MVKSNKSLATQLSEEEKRELRRTFDFTISEDDWPAIPHMEAVAELVRGVVGQGGAYIPYQYIIGVVRNKPDKLREWLALLSDKEQFVVVMRFGLTSGNRQTLKEVGDQFGVSRERVRQIEAKSLAKLRHPRRGYEPFNMDQMPTPGPNDSLELIGLDGHRGLEDCKCIADLTGMSEEELRAKLDWGVGGIVRELERFNLALRP